MDTPSFNEQVDVELLRRFAGQKLDQMEAAHTDSARLNEESLKDLNESKEKAVEASKAWEDARELLAAAEVELKDNPIDVDAVNAHIEKLEGKLKGGQTLKSNELALYPEDADEITARHEQKDLKHRTDLESARTRIKEHDARVAQVATLRADVDAKGGFAKERADASTMSQRHHAATALAGEKRQQAITIQRGLCCRLEGNDFAKICKDNHALLEEYRNNPAYVEAYNERCDALQTAKTAELARAATEAAELTKPPATAEPEPAEAAKPATEPSTPLSQPQDAGSEASQGLSETIKVWNDQVKVQVPVQVPAHPPPPPPKPQPELQAVLENDRYRLLYEESQAKIQTFEARFQQQETQIQNLWAVVKAQGGPLPLDASKMLPKATPTKGFEPIIGLDDNKLRDRIYFLDKARQQGRIHRAGTFPSMEAKAATWDLSPWVKFCKKVMVDTLKQRAEEEHREVRVQVVPPLDRFYLAFMKGAKWDRVVLGYQPKDKEPMKDGWLFTTNRLKFKDFIEKVLTSEKLVLAKGKDIHMFGDANADWITEAKTEDVRQYERDNLDEDIRKVWNECEPSPKKQKLVNLT